MVSLSNLPNQPTKPMATKRTKPVQAFLRQNIDAVETYKPWIPCYVTFRGRFAGLGAIYTQLRLPAPGQPRVPLDTCDIGNTFIPYAVMNRFGLVVNPHRAVCKVQISSRVTGLPVCIDKSRRLTINNKVYACPPVHEQDNWSATWKYRLEVGLCQCTMLDNHIMFRPVVNIVDK